VDLDAGAGGRGGLGVVDLDFEAVLGVRERGRGDDGERGGGERGDRADAGGDGCAGHGRFIMRPFRGAR